MDGLIVSVGGASIQVAGSVVGGVGVSGVPYSEIAEKCVQAGADVVSAD